MPIIQTDKPLQPRAKADFYPTDYAVAAAALEFVRTDGIHRILDPGAGTGVWGEAARQRFPQSEIVGVEVRREVQANAIYNLWITANFRAVRFEPFDLVMGNPPYKHAEYFVGRSLQLIKPTKGVLVQLLPLSFLAGQTRRKTLYRRCPPNVVYVMSRRPSFIHTGEKAGNTDATEYAIYVWDLRLPPAAPIIRWFDWQDIMHLPVSIGD